MQNDVAVVFLVTMIDRWPWVAQMRRASLQALAEYFSFRDDCNISV